MATLQVRTAKDGTRSYRCRVQRRGYPVQSATFPTKQEAQRWGQMVEGEIATGRHFAPKPTSMTFAEFLVQYQAVIQAQKTPETQRNQASTLQHWHSVLGYKLLSEITPRDLAEQRDVLLKTKKASTVVHQLRVLSAVFTAAVKDFAVLETNPMFKVMMPSQSQGRVRYLSREKRERLLRACQASRNAHLYGLVLCAISTGMRCGELLNIRYGDCDLERGIIHLERIKTKRRRDVPLTGKALEMLRAMSQGHSPAEYVFPATNRQAPFRSYRKAWEFARKRAEIENYHFHDNHHSTGSYLEPIPIGSRSSSVTRCPCPTGIAS
jgi:integrase